MKSLVVLGAATTVFAPIATGGVASFRNGLAFRISQDADRRLIDVDWNESKDFWE